MRNHLRCFILLLLLLLSLPAKAVTVILAGGVALRSWEELRGPEAHDRWWANFIRASTLDFSLMRKENPQEKIVWIVFRPAYITRQKAEGKPLVKWIEENAVKYKVRLIWVDSAQETYDALNSIPRITGQRISKFTYYGHSNAYAFMLDYSNSIIGASKHWIHEKDLRTKINPTIFTRDAVCVSFGCYTGLSMSKRWMAALGVPLWGNTDSTDYTSLSHGKLPIGMGKWVY